MALEASDLATLITAVVGGLAVLAGYLNNRKERPPSPAEKRQRELDERTQAELRRCDERMATLERRNAELEAQLDRCEDETRKLKSAHYDDMERTGARHRIRLLEREDEIEALRKLLTERGIEVPPRRRVE